MQVYCQYCSKEYESTAEGCDHWPDGPDEKCAVEVADDEWSLQSHWGDHINKAVKESNDRTTKRSDHPDLEK